MIKANILKNICKVRAKKHNQNCYIGVVEKELDKKQFEIHKYPKKIMLLDKKSITGKYFKNFEELNDFIEKNESV